MALFAISLGLAVALLAAQRSSLSLDAQFICALSAITISALLVYRFVVCPLVRAARDGESKLGEVSRALEDSISTSSAQTDALSSALARLKLQGLAVDRVAIISETDPRGVITQVNDNFCRISGYAREELIGKTHAIVNSKHHPKSFWVGMYETMAGGQLWQAEVCNRRKDGSLYWVQCINTAMRDKDGKLRGYLSLRMDISEARMMQARLNEQNIKLDAALKHMSQGLAMFDDNQRLVMCNEKFAAMYALPVHLTAPGTFLSSVIENHAANGTYKDGIPTEYQSEHLSKVALVPESQHELLSGKSIAVVRSAMPNGGWVSTHEDITHRRRLENRLEHLALHDGLTDLPNRILLGERFAQALTSREDGNSVSVLYLDLDRFKQVNDTLGHAAGDALLKAVAKRIQSCVRASDTVSRVGGDEFIVVQPSSAPAEAASQLAQRLISIVGAPYVILGKTVEIGVSIGISISPRDGVDQDELLHKADLALYRSKSGGRGRHSFYGPDAAAQATTEPSPASRGQKRSAMA